MSLLHSSSVFCFPCMLKECHSIWPLNIAVFALWHAIGCIVVRNSGCHKSSDFENSDLRSPKKLRPTRCIKNSDPRVCHNLAFPTYMFLITRLFVSGQSAVSKVKLTIAPGYLCCSMNMSLIPSLIHLRKSNHTALNFLWSIHSQLKSIGL